MEGEVLRDDQWEQIEQFVPGGRKGKRGPRSDGRRFFNALLWVARLGERWHIFRSALGRIRRRNGAIIAGSRWVCSIDCLKLSPASLISNG